MDTRNKIIGLARALDLLANGGSWRIVLGHWDPLLAAHARALRAAGAGRNVLAVVTDPPRPLLALGARAELVAALAVVDYVLPLPGHERAGFLEASRPHGILDEEAEDERRARGLAQYVHARQTG